MAGANDGVARGPRGPRHWRETQSEGGQPGGGSGAKTLVSVRQWGAAPSLLVHVGQTHPICE
ncbi:unnamed protein product, partial [Musa hybrid cultivar]